jgi:lactam utilization protein B
VACGFHAGDPVVMYETVLLAKKYGVAVGAHTGLEDRRCYRGSQCRHGRKLRQVPAGQ